MKEITAEILAVGEGFSTHGQSTIKLNGGQWDANVDTLIRENEKLNGQTPDPHQSGSSTGQTPPAEGGEGEGDNGDGNPHNPENTRRLARKAMRELVITEQIKNSIREGGHDNGEN